PVPRPPRGGGKLLEVHCGACRPERHLYIDAGSLDLPKRMPMPEVANHLVCSRCGARNSDTYHLIWVRPDARVPGVTANIRTSTSANDNLLGCDAHQRQATMHQLYPRRSAKGAWRRPREISHLLGHLFPE